MATTIEYDTADVDGLKLFYREAGPAEAPKVLLLKRLSASLTPATSLWRRNAREIAAAIRDFLNN